LLSTVVFGFLLYGFSEVGEKGWGSPVVIIGIIVGVIFVISLAIPVRPAGKFMGNLQIGKGKLAEPTLLPMRLRPAPSPKSRWSIFFHC